jgi:hypothetical protein
MMKSLINYITSGISDVEQNRVDIRSSKKDIENCLLAANAPMGKWPSQPEFLKDKLSNSDEWKEFVEMCFNPGSPINNKLKEMLVQIAGDGKP